MSQNFLIGVETLCKGKVINQVVQDGGLTGVKITGGTINVEEVLFLRLYSIVKMRGVSAKPCSYCCSLIDRSDENVSLNYLLGHKRLSVLHNTT